MKNFAISAFGSNDKTVLVAGILAVLAIFAAIVGALAVRRLWYGMAGLACFAALGLAAALTRPTASPSYAVPTLVGAAAAAVALALLVRFAPPAVAAASADDVSAERAPDRPVRPEPGPGRPAGVARPPRRSFLVTGSAVAGTAAVAYFGGRLLAERSNVARAQASLRVPRPAHPAPPLPAGSDLRIPGLSSFITPNGSFYRVDTAIVLPQIPPAGWQLRVHGMVAREIRINFDQLIRRPLSRGRALRRQRALGRRERGQPAAPGGRAGRRRPAAVHLR